MIRVSDLRSRLAKLLDEARSIEASSDGLTPEQETRSAELMGEVEKLEQRIARAVKFEEAERRMAGTTIAGTGDDRFDEQMRSASLLRAIAAQIPGSGVDGGREREISAELARRSGRPANGILVPMSIFHRAIEQRVVTTAAPAAGPGSNLIATDHLGNQFIDILRARMIVRRLGARVLSGLTGNVDIPKLTKSATVGWVAENQALTPSDPEFDSLGLTPKHCGGIVELSRNMILQSSPDVEQLVRNDFAQVLAREVDRVAINGGATNEPKGVLQTSGLDVGTTMATPTWEDVLDLISKVEEADSAGLAFITRPAVVKLLRSTVRVGSTDSAMIMDAPNMLAGYPLASTTITPGNLGDGDNTALIFGDWTEIMLGFWSELDILVNPFEATAYPKGNVSIRAMMTMDVGVRHIESFAAAVDIDYGQIS